MSKTETSGLQQEWLLLQKQAEDYEKLSLVIKLLSFIVVALLLVHSRYDFLSPIVCLLLWAQDGIWKAFQSRTCDRLLGLEKAISEQNENLAMQFHSEWEKNRPGFVGLIVSYIKHCLKPTVVFPHAILTAIAAVLVYYL